MSLKPNYLEERICLNVLANSVENAQACYEAAEGHVVLGVLSKNYETDEAAIDD
ncbi:MULTISPECIES: KDGP aldolase, partial [Bacteria]